MDIPSAPTAEEMIEAKHHCGGYIYRFAGEFADDEDVPPEAIIGAWNVNDLGVIEGPFIFNDNYDPSLYPCDVD
jgi:hypothetical protein